MGDLMEDKKEHESYAVIGISRVQGSPPGHALFDSPFRHQHWIDIVVIRASKARHLHEDYIHGGEELIRVSMSEVQFANLITSANIGTGVPCTISRFDGKSMKQPPADTTRETYSKEIKVELAEIKKDADELEKLVAMSSPKAAEKARMRDLAGKIQRAFSDDLAFFQRQFEKKMEKAVSSARAEIQAHVTHIVQKAGLKAIKEGEEPFRLEDSSKE